MYLLKTMGTAALFPASSENQQVPLPSKQLALLVLLARAGRGPMLRRDLPLALLWPKLDQAHGRGALRQAVYGLRKRLGHDVIVTQGEEEIGLASSVVVCDASEFEHACRAGDHARASALYQGDFLASFHVAEAAPEFEEWVEDERRQLRQAAVQAAIDASETDEGEGRVSCAVRHARRAVELSPDDESVVARLITLLDRTGDRSGALEAYTVLVHRLSVGFGVEPAPETRLLVERIRARNGAVAARVHDSPVREWPGSGNSTGEVTARGTWTHPAPTGVALARPRRAYAVLALGIAMTASLPLIAWLALHPSPRDTRRVLVGRFEDRSNDPSITALVPETAAEIVNGLASTGLVEPLGDPSASAARDLAGMQPMARRLGAASVVSGMVTRHGDSLEFQVWLTDAGTGMVLRPVQPVTVHAAQQRLAPALVAQRVMAAFAARNDLLLNPESKVGQPATYDAYREYQSGVALEYATEWFDEASGNEVLGHFRQAIALDDAFIQPRVRMAVLYGILGMCSATDSVAASIRDRGFHLLPVDAAELDFAIAQCHEDSRALYEAARTLFELQPRSAERVHQLTRAAVSIRPNEVLQCTTRLNGTADRNPGWEASCENFMIKSYHQLGQFREGLEMVARLSRDHPDDPMFGRHPLVERYQMRQWAALGMVERVNALMDQRVMRSSRQVRAGDDMVWIGEELRAHGSLDAGRELCLRGVQWYRELPASEVDLDARSLEAKGLYCAERWPEAYAAYLQLVAMDSAGHGLPSFPTAGDAAAIRMRLGALAIRLGDSRTAARMEAWLDSQSGPRAALGQAVLFFMRGDTARALGAFRFYWDRGLSRYDRTHVDPALEPLRAYPPIRALIYNTK